MANYIDHALFGWYPYVCLTVLVAGSILRFDLDQYTWKTSSSQLLRNRQFFWGSNLFHVGVLIILIGHIGGLLTPIQIFEFLGISHSFKQMLAIVVGGFGAVLALTGITLLTHRRLFDPRIRAHSSFADTAILLILFLQLLLGAASIFVSLQHLDGGEMVKFMKWAQGTLLLQTNAWEYVKDAHLIFKMHIVLGLTILLLVPFTRLVHIISMPVWYLGRRGYQVVRSRRNLTPAE